MSLKVNTVRYKCVKCPFILFLFLETKVIFENRILCLKILRISQDTLMPFIQHKDEKCIITQTRSQYNVQCQQTLINGY